MHRLLSDKAGERQFLLGNEAIARGALEAGVAVATTYPGTPATEIGDTFFALAKFTDRFYFEFSTNEKVAMEVAAGAAVAGVRALVSMKHVGLNVASDPLMTLAYLGVNGGLVVVTADEPGCHSSQNEQDNRLYARLANLPLLEPATPAEAQAMTRFGFELSEQVGLPVILRTTTRVSHMRGVVTLAGLPAEVRHQVEFQREPERFSYNPGVARRRRGVLLEQMDAARRIAEEAEQWNPILGEGPLGVLVSGVGYNYVRDAATALGLASQVRIGKLGLSHPVPEDWLRRFLHGLEQCLVVEEVEPLMEQHAKAVAYEAGLAVPIRGRASGIFPRNDELTLSGVTAALAELAGVAHVTPAAQPPPPLPGRPPSLCPGCTHRNTFYAAKLAAGDEAHFHQDIGCYTLGQLPPLELCDLLICMGAGVSTAAGMARVTDKPQVAFIGDSTFFHAGVPGLLNAVHNRHRLVLTVMDNRTTAMTGHQPHPGTALDGMQRSAPEISIETLCRGAGVDFVEVVDPSNLRQAVDAFQRALSHPQVAVIISRGACLFVERPPADQPVFAVDPERCCFCGLHGDHVGCGETLHGKTQLVRAFHRIRALDLEANAPGRQLPDKPQVAPCTQDCPAHLCVQSYATLIAAGRYEDAARAVRERIPLPATVARVCHRPCEPRCTRGDHDEPVAINALKRFAMEHEDADAVAAALQRQLSVAPRRDGRVAIIGAGPAGLAAAHDLRLRGFAVTIFEAASVPGGLLALGIPAYRLERAVLHREIGLITALGIEVRLNARVGDTVAWDELVRDYDAVLVAAGAWKGARLAIPGEDAAGLEDALAFLTAANLGQPPAVGQRVVVIGGGDAAVDAARVAKRLGQGEVTIAYRRTRDEMPASADEIQQAEKEGIRLQWQMTPVAVLTGDGRVVGLRLVRTAPGEPDASGRRRPVAQEGSEFDLVCDHVIVAIGQKVDLPFLPDAVSRTRFGTLKVDPDTGATGLAGVFAAGDVVTGPKTVIHAIAAGQRAAHGIDQHLAQGRWEAAQVVGPAEDPAGALRYEPSHVAPAARLPEPAVPPQGRVAGFEPVTRGLDEAAARQEAARCLVCGQCAKCRVCVDTFGCPAIVVDQGRIKIDRLLCVGCGVCAQVCPNNAIHPVTDPAEGGRA